MTVGADSDARGVASRLIASIRSNLYVKLAVQLAPGMFWLIAFVVIPILLVFLYSFYRFSNGTMIETLTLENYLRVFHDTIYLKVFIKSLRYGLIVTLACLFIGYPVAYFLARSTYKRRDPLFLALIIPFWTSIVVRTYAWKMLLGTNGLFNYYLGKFGLIDAPIRLLYTEQAVLVGLVHVFLPFMILPLYAALEKIDPSLEEAAMDLGANRFRTFLKIILPLSVPGVSTGCLLVFILAIGSFLTPDLLGGSSQSMISNIIRGEFYITFNWPFGSALAVLLLVIILTMVAVYNRLFKVEKIMGE